MRNLKELRKLNGSVVYGYQITNRERMHRQRAARGGYTKSQAARNRKRNYAKELLSE